MKIKLGNSARESSQGHMGHEVSWNFMKINPYKSQVSDWEERILCNNMGWGCEDAGGFGRNQAESEPGMCLAARKATCSRTEESGYPPDSALNISHWVIVYSFGPT